MPPTTGRIGGTIPAGNLHDPFRSLNSATHDPSTCDLRPEQLRGRHKFETRESYTCLRGQGVAEGRCRSQGPVNKTEPRRLAACVWQ